MWKENRIRPVRPSILKGDIVTGIIPVIPLDSEWYSTDNRLGGVQGGRGGGKLLMELTEECQIH